MIPLLGKLTVNLLGQDVSQDMAVKLKKIVMRFIHL